MPPLYGEEYVLVFMYGGTRLTETMEEMIGRNIERHNVEFLPLYSNVKLCFQMSCNLQTTVNNV